MARRPFLVLFLFLSLCGTATPTWACRCVPYRSFDEVVKTAPVVLLGRVKYLAPSKAGDSEIAYADVEVVETYRGEWSPGVVRIWDVNVGNTCGNRLAPLRPEQLVVFSVISNQESFEWRDSQGPRPDSEDFHFKSCGQFWQQFKTEAEARQAMKQLGFP